MHGHSMNMENDKAKDFKKSIINIFTFNKKFIPFILIALLFSTFSSILSIIGPDKLKDITDLISEGMFGKIDLTKIKNIGIFLGVIYILSFLFSYFQGFIMSFVTNKITNSMRKAISIKINKLPLSYFDNVSIGDILSRITNDVDTIGQTLNESISSLVGGITMFIGSSIMMFYTNAIMALTGIISSFIGLIIMVMILKKSQKYFNNVQDGLGKINGHIEEMFSGQSIVKVYNATKEMEKEFESINEKLFKDGIKSQYYSGLMMPLMSFIGNLGYVMVCIVGAMLVFNGHITFGVIVAFIIYVRLFTQPLSQLAQGLGRLQGAAASSERIFEFLGEKEMEEENGSNFVTLDKKDVKGNIEFEHVKFGYNKDKIIINDFSTKVKSGQKVAIVGETGAGKTTIVNLLMKFYDIFNGDIKIDGVSIKNLTRENVHSLFTMVLQDTWLFNGTIRENIVFNNENVSEEEINKAIDTVGLRYFINSLSRGIDTNISDGDSVSLGQKQLLTIGRSVIEDTPFIILDEATSSVDTRTEKIVQEAYDKISKGKTSFIIAHRLSTIKNADLILVMKNGDIVEQGSHDELLNLKGIYFELYNSQFK